ncbi:hypothetical protein B0H11DRAFT_2398665 [Mycena galericulata]|nr:hypothetical protein B0H11DRAFT_2398665 [Mycena galericulata]
MTPGPLGEDDRRQRSEVELKSEEIWKEMSAPVEVGLFTDLAKLEHIGGFERRGSAGCARVRGAKRCRVLREARDVRREYPVWRRRGAARWALRTLLITEQGTRPGCGGSGAEIYASEQPTRMSRYGEYAARGCAICPLLARQFPLPRNSRARRRPRDSPIGLTVRLRPESRGSRLGVESPERNVPKTKFAYLQYIVESDLKPDNILLDERGNAHLTHFNISLKFTERRLMGVAGSMAYMAPDYNIDWWSLGVCAYELIFGRRPFRGGTNSDLTYSITKDPLKWPANAEKKCSRHGTQVLKGLLDRDPLDVLAAKKANFDASHELEELLLEDNPLKAKTRKANQENFSPEMRQMEEQFTSYDFKKMQRRSNDLLDELAAHSGFSHVSVRVKHSHATRRSKTTIIRELYRSLAPLDASFLTQIILKDLRPLLYPVTETHYNTVALKAYNSVAVTHLNKEDAMNAWDPSRRMLAIYRVRSGLDDASAAFEAGITDTSMPRIGTPVEIPKSEKGRSCLHTLEMLRTSYEIWAETKYDGERAQIHVEILADGDSRITIFSKSKRDSTLDRHGIHGLIRQALCLPKERHAGRGQCSVSQVRSNVILDAEMVAWHEGKIDGLTLLHRYLNVHLCVEFWRIRSLVEHTAVGPRHNTVQDDSPINKSIYLLVPDSFI